MGPILPISGTTTGIFVLATSLLEKLQFEHDTNEPNASRTASCFRRAQSGSLASFCINVVKIV
jgi:hypothetical protein